MVLDQAAREFLDAHRVARFATASGEGEPHLVPLCYARCDDDIYFVIDEKPKRHDIALKRLRNLRANPRVALLVDDYDEDWRRLAYLLLHGTAAVVAERAEYERALSALRARYPQYRDMALGFDANPMVRIAPLRVRLWRAAA